MTPIFETIFCWIRRSGLQPQDNFQQFFEFFLNSIAAAGYFLLLKRLGTFNLAFMRSRAVACVKFDI